MENTVNNENKKLMTVQDVAERLNCSSRLIYSMKSYGRMPLPIKLGKLVRWNRDAIEKWIADGCPSHAKTLTHMKWKR